MTAWGSLSDQTNCCVDRKKSEQDTKSGVSSGLSENPQEDEHNVPTEHFTISEPQYQEIGEFYVVQNRRRTDYEARKL